MLRMFVLMVSVLLTANLRAGTHVQVEQVQPPCVEQQVLVAPPAPLIVQQPAIVYQQQVATVPMIAVGAETRVREKRVTVTRRRLFGKRRAAAVAVPLATTCVGTSCEGVAN